MAQKCAVIGCKSKKGDVQFYKFPEVSYQPFTNRKSTLSENRRALWIEALKRGDFIPKNAKICSKHFFTGQPAPSEWTDHIDWAPSLNMGHDTLQKCEMKTKTNGKEVPIISLDSDDEEAILGYDAGIVPYNFKETEIGSSSSATITATSPSYESGNERDTSGTSHTNIRESLGKIFVSEKIFRSPDKGVRKCQPLIPTHSIRNVVSTPTKNLSNEKVVAKQQAIKPKIPPNQQTKSMITQSVSNHSLDGSTIHSTMKTQEKVPCSPIGVQNINNIQKKQKVNIGPKNFLEKNKKFVTFDFPTKRIIQNQKVFVPIPPEITDESGKNVQLSTQIPPNDLERDPLYIPKETEKSSVGEIAQVTRSKTTNEKTIIKKRTKNCVMCIDPSKPSTSSHSCESKSRKANKEPTSSEHLIVKNYAVQNIATKLTKVGRQTCVTNNRTKILMDPALQIKTDCCRNFFIKNSAWDFLESEFKGFNEREKQISQNCSGYLGELVENLNMKQELDENCHLGLRVKSSTGKTLLCGINKRKAENTYKYPPTKKCKIVLRRNDFIERKVKQMMLQEKLDSYILEYLTFSSEDANKPLIILNKQNFNILRVNETLSKYSNVIYVKDGAEKFSEQLLANTFAVKHIERGGIKVVSPKALKNFICDKFLSANCE